LDNIDKFSAYTGKILAKLHQAFPQPTFIDASEIATGKPTKGSGPDGSVSVNDLQATTLNADVVFCAHTIRWLYETGYFTGQMSQYDVRVSNAVLTPKSFEALAAVPDVLDGNKQTLGQRLGNFATSTASDAVKGGVNQIVGQVIGAALRGFIGPSSAS
jgi:hypothetical protein